MKYRLTIIFVILWLFPVALFAITKNEQRFIQMMGRNYNFNTSKLTKLFQRTKLLPEIVRRIKTPHEGKPWYEYKPIFITPERIKKGVVYWVNHHATLNRAQKIYGIPPDIITAIIGVETFYGGRQGRFSILSSLATLSFLYPPRAHFFQSELAQYLLLTREQKLKPEKILGSYAGAMGYPQFMPSSYRIYAIDFNGDGKKDIFHDTSDVIGSIANYLKLKGWIRGGHILIRAKVTGEKYKKLLNNDLEVKFSLATLKKYGITPVKKLEHNYLVNLIRLKTKTSPEYWLGFHNFYVITKYNTHVKYAMAVCLLAAEIKSLYE